MSSIYNSKPRPALSMKMSVVAYDSRLPQLAKKGHGLANYFAYAKEGWHGKGKDTQT